MKRKTKKKSIPYDKLKKEKEGRITIDKKLAKKQERLQYKSELRYHS